MEETKSKTKIWFFHCFLLYAPFAFEIFIVAPLMLYNEPQWIWGALFWVHSYITYGLVCLIHAKWRKKIGVPISFRCNKSNIKWIALAIFVGAIAGHLSEVLFFNWLGVPMLLGDILTYARQEPLWMGIGAFLMQYIYYLFEFTVVAYMVDCAQKTSEKLGWTQKIPWGGIFIALTWGFGHYFSKGNLANGLASMFLCLFVGIVYLFLGKKPIYAWVAVAAAYWL